MKGEAHQNAPGRPARPTQPKRARTGTDARDRGVASSDLKEEVLVSTRNIPGAPAKSPVESRAVRETGRVSDRVHPRQTTTAHAAQDRSRRDPPGITPSRGPERVRCGAGPAPLPRQGPAVGTMSLVLGRPQRAPRSRPLKPGSPRGGGRHHGDGKAEWSTESDRTGQGAPHQRGAKRHAGEARRRPQSRHKERCQPATATRCRKPRKRAQHMTNRGTAEGAKASQAPSPHTAPRADG